MSKAGYLRIKYLGWSVHNFLEMTAYIIGFDPINLRCLSSAGLVNADLSSPVK